MSLYPTLEDMKVDQMQQAEQAYHNAAARNAAAIVYPQQQPGAAPSGMYPPQASDGTSAASQGGSLYPSLEEYMGLALTPQMMDQCMPVATTTPPQDMQVGVRETRSGQMQVAPITGNDVGLRRAEIKQGIREVIMCKDGKGKIGLRVKGVNKGLFVAFVHVNTPASMAGLRFGDQILQINGENVAGWSTEKAMEVLRKCSPDRITMAIRDRPFERTISMQKDSTGHIGFVFKDGKVTAIVKDSSAARNGMLIDHQLIEVNGQNVVGLKDKEVGQIIDAHARTITVTIMPSFIYDHIVKCIGSSFIKKFMDHSIPDV